MPSVMMLNWLTVMHQLQPETEYNNINSDILRNVKVDFVTQFALSVKGPFCDRNC